MKKTLSLLLVLSMLFGILAGCSGTSSTSSGDSSSSSSGTDGSTSDDSSSETVVTEDGETVVYISVADGDPGTLDVFSSTGSAWLQSCMQIYDRLIDYNEDGELVGCLAKDYVREDDTLTFYLYEDIYDTDGNHFTASDAVWCLEELLEVGNTDVSPFDNPTYVDDYTFTLDIVTDSVTVMNNFTSICFVTQAAYEASGNNMATSVVATGAYKVENYVTGATLTLVKNEDYWQDDITCMIQEQNVDKIVYNFMTESSQISVALEDGTLDFAFLDWTVAERFTDGTVSGNYNADEVETWGGNDLWFNLSDSNIFADNQDLRLAIFYAIDKEAIVDAVWDGHAQVPKAYGNYNYPDADPAWQDEDYFDYDFEKAQEYFAASGYSAGELSLRLLYPTSSYCDNMAEIIQGYLNALGIDVELMGLENAIYTEYLWDDSQWDICFAGGGGDGSITRIWANRLDLNNFTNDYCYGFLNDPELQTLVELACSPDTHSQETVNAVHYYLKEKAYVMRLYIEYKCVVSNADKITEVCLNSDARPIPGAFTYVWNS